MTIDSFLTDDEHAAFEKYCKGCVYFKRNVSKKDICNIIAWSSDTYLEYILEDVKNCPCIKCLVKAACTETVCDDWRNYVGAKIIERSKNSDTM